MKKKLALLLVAAMTVTAIPATSFAGTTNRVAKVVTAQVDDIINTSITFEDKGDTTNNEQITVTLTNAEWDFDALNGKSDGDNTDAIEEAKKALEEAEKALEEAKTAAEEAQAKVDNFDQVIADAKKYIAEHDSDKDIVVADELAKVTAAQKEVDEANKVVEAANKTVAAEEKALEEAKEKLAKAEKAYEDAIYAEMAKSDSDYATAKGVVDAGDLDEKVTAAEGVVTDIFDDKGNTDAVDDDGTLVDAKKAVKTAEDKVAPLEKAVEEAQADYEEKKALKEKYDEQKAIDANSLYELEKAKDAAVKAKAEVTKAEAKVADAEKALEEAENGTAVASGIKFTKITAKEALVDISGYAGKDIRLPIIAEITDEGDVQATIDPMSSNISGGTYTVAIGADGGSKTTIEKSTDISDSSTQIKPIVITETTAGSFKAGEVIKLKLGGNFTYTESKTPKVTTPSGDGKVEFVKVDEDTIEIKVTEKSTKATKIVVDNLWIEEDDAEVGNEAEITVSGAGTSKTTLTVGKYVDYGFSFKAEDEEVPVLYSGRENGDTDVLKVTFKETAPKSWFTGRKATITLPEGVKFTKVEVSDKDNLKKEGTVEIDSKDRSIANIEGFEVVDGKKGEVEIEMEIEVSPKFTGDVVATLSGPAVSNEELTAVVAKVESPVKVEAKRTDVSIDYRNVEVADITITEAYAGALEKGKVLTLEAEKMEFEGGWDWEVTEGDIKIDDVTKSGGKLSIKVKSESSKTPGTIKISGLKVYLDRTLPVGDYKLKLVATDADKAFNTGDAFFQTHDDDATDKKPGFDCDSVTAVEDYIRVVTAGRDQDDSTFTTKITVTVGESTLTAGDKVIELDVPAFINADSRAMLPVRAVIEALSGTVAIKWDDATKTAFFSMGSRVFSMTVGQKTMSINGTNVAMTTAPVIVNERIFIPLRDLGVALGLNDDKIVWDDATKTATLNGTAADKTTDK